MDNFTKLGGTNNEKIYAGAVAANPKAAGPAVKGTVGGRSMSAKAGEFVAGTASGSTTASGNSLGETAPAGEFHAVVKQGNGSKL